MRKSLAILFIFSFFLSSLSHGKWIDPEEEAMKNHQVRAWRGVDFTFTGFSSSTGTSAVTYRNAVNDFWGWSAGAGVDSLGWFFTGGGNYFLYNSPHSTCFFAFSCHGQILAGAGLYYANGGRRTFTNNGVDTIYDQGSSIYALPQVSFRSIYREFFSLTLDAGYRVMVQSPDIHRSYGPDVPSNVNEMEKANANGLGASASLGIVF